MVRRMKEGASQKYVLMKQRINKAQGKAKTVGFLYLIATLAITALACLPLITISDELVQYQLGVTTFWKTFVDLVNAGFEGWLNLAVIVAVIYTVMLLVLVVNVFKSLGKLDWLYKRKASRVYGFNRNVYAMDDLGRLFSSSFATVVIAHLLIAFFVAEVQVGMLAYAALGLGLFIHFVCGLVGGNVSLFDTEEGLVEQKREYGRVSVVVRNVFQIAASVGIMYFVWTSHMVRVIFTEIFAGDNLQAMMADPMQLVVPALEIVGLIFAFSMLTYALSTTEFDIEGKETCGRRNFLLYSFFTLVFVGGSLAYSFVMEKVAFEALPQATLMIAAIAAVAFLVDLILCAFPKVKRAKAPKVRGKKVPAVKPYSEEVDIKTYIKETFDRPGVYNNYNNAAFSPMMNGMYEMPARK